jgi:hypothetical protein
MAYGLPQLFYGFWFVVGYILYAVAIFANINTLRKIHSAYIKGYYFQKECGDEYTEYESFRRQTYEALKNNRNALDTGSYLFIVLLFWVPFSILILIMAQMIGVSLAWAGIFGIIGVYFFMVMLNVGIYPDKNTVTLYQYFQGSYCDETGIQNLSRHKLLQGLLFFVGGMVLYGYYVLQSKYDQQTKSVFINKFPGVPPEVGAGAGADKLQNYLNATPPEQRRFGYKIYSIAQEKKPLFYAFVFMWLMAFIWLYFSNSQYHLLRSRVLCYYEELIGGYKEAIRGYLFPGDGSKDTDQRFKMLKEHVERNYLRIHGTMPPTILDGDVLINDYALYLMNWKGREFEGLKSSPELDRLREYMFRMRNDRVYSTTLKSFFSFCYWYYWIQFILVIYIVFHTLYAFLGLDAILTVGVAVGGILLLFVLSWYAWFDVALFA